MADSSNNSLKSGFNRGLGMTLGAATAAVGIGALAVVCPPAAAVAVKLAAAGAGVLTGKSLTS
jgi:hypothetical protein